MGMKACHHGCVLSVKFIDKAKQTITEVEKRRSPPQHCFLLSLFTRVWVWLYESNGFRASLVRSAFLGIFLCIYAVSVCPTLKLHNVHGYLCIFCLGGGLIAFEETCTLSFYINLTKSVSSLELYVESAQWIESFYLDTTDISIGFGVKQILLCQICWPWHH